MHIAIFNLSRFNQAYFERHLAGNQELLEQLYEYCGLWYHFNGMDIPTFKEMSEGLSATHRTCALFKEFAKQAGLPDPGVILADLSSRGTNRIHRSRVKRATRTGLLVAYSADCAIEIFTH